MTWKCPGCGEIYLQHECATCHMKGDPWLQPVVVTYEGAVYLVKRQIRGAATVVTEHGWAVQSASTRAGVLRAFLSQQHPSV